MIDKQLQQKINMSIKLLQLYNDSSNPICISYSGGKDSDVILQLAKEAGINYVSIYKNTTIDPPGTIQHVREMGVEIMQPRNGITFFKLIDKYGYPSRWRRYCCRFLKEYKTNDKVVIGVRKDESTKRRQMYNEPTECRYFGKEHVEQVYPILEWTNDDVKCFIEDRGIRCAPVYYDEVGEFHVERRLGCMCCPIKSHKNVIEDFKNHPNIIRAYLRHGKIYLDSHKDNEKLAQAYNGDQYAYFYRHFFAPTRSMFEQTKLTIFGQLNYKEELEAIFGIKL